MFQDFTMRGFLDEAKTQIAKNSTLRDTEGSNSFPLAASIYRAFMPNEVTGPSEALLFMVALKLARAQVAHNKGKFNADDYVDAIAYLSMLAQHRAKTAKYPVQGVRVVVSPEDHDSNSEALTTEGLTSND